MVYPGTMDLEKGIIESFNAASRAENELDATRINTTNTRSSTSSKTQGFEELLEEARRSNPHGTAQVSIGVSIQQAEADFAHLQRQLSRLSRGSRHENHHVAGDAEKGHIVSGSPVSEEVEQFDLEGALRGGLDAEREAGIRPKHIGVYWDGLTVKGLGGSSNFVKTFPDAFTDFLDFITPIKKALGVGKNVVEATLLDSFRGVCKPGEMVLVLGKPGSGCTTFLKNIANQRHGYTDVLGEVLYGPFDAKEFKQYRGEAAYNQEDDIHHATLTVEQTLGFALDVKTPGKLPAGLTKKDFKDKVITTLLKMFNMEHTRHTVLGNQIIRGISGGEKKRVSIAEMMVTNACVLSWDNSTRGLDASTALDFIKSLRIQTDLYKTSTFVSLYQASENIYRLFDKVLVIDEGKQVYFGSTLKARAYFEGLGFLPRPRQTTPDYVTGCTDDFEREYQEGRSPKNAPHSPATLAIAFQQSGISKALEQEMIMYKNSLVEETQKHEDFRVAVHEQKRRGAHKKSAYSVGFQQQVWALMKRQFVLKMQDRLTLILMWARSIVIALVLGTLYLNLGRTSASAFSKGGLIFISLLFNALSAFAELAGTMTGRPVINKHNAYAFHRPSALWIAQIIIDQAFAATQIMVFCLIAYFMSNLYRSAGAFFTFYLFVLLCNITMTLLFRTIGCMSPDFDYAVKFAVTTITFFIITCGYLIQYQSEQIWLRWIYWINVLGLAFHAMMENEFSSINMTCTDDSLVPAGPGYHDINYQVCTLPGSTPGSLDISGSAYLHAGFSYNHGELWRNCGIILALIVFSLVANVVVGEVVKHGMGGNTAKTFQKPNEERKKLNEELLRKRDERRGARKNEDNSSELKINSKGILTWENLCYEVPVPGGNLQLLDHVFGYVKPGQLTALMGASGAGKTTLLDVLAARKNVGVISGEILVDGKKPGMEFQRSTSYAEQADLHEPSQTAREALRFSADLRQLIETSREDKYAYVEEIISLLEMESFAEAIIGSAESGLTVEQRKRVTIGVELAARPQLLLFLDEPTSGLDSQSAFNIVRFLKKLAAAGQAILCTIHQPNAALFENFDRLLLLKSGGRCVYFGDIGKDAIILSDYLKRHGAVAKETDNVAEFMLEAIGAGSAPRIGNRDWADIWLESPELANVKDSIAQMKTERIAAGVQEGTRIQREFASPVWHQLKVVVKRATRSYWRSPNYLFTRLFNHVIIAVLTGLTFLNLDDSRQSLQYKMFVMFQVTVLPALVVSQIEVRYHMERALFFREQSSKMYSSFVFAASMVVAELPCSVLCAACFFLPIYYMPGLQTESSRAGYQFIMVLITELFSVTMAQALSALTPSLFVSSQFDPVIMITFALFCGITIPATQMPGFWRAWLYQLDPFTRLIGGMAVTALHDLPVVCRGVELNVFNAPPGQTCGEYLRPFFEDGGAGYLVNATAMGECEYCPYRVGDEFYEKLGLSFDHRWRDMGIFLGFLGSNLVILFLAVSKPISALVACG
ncbi:ABC-2 type transporter-domain-containing protein [Lasiosphaeris hirsuta]|uniref:ABC-2 type transporter-domain-containing protein n=1 Tax=Lasiosphaeris hirsuta TaxID=260670 RepID=A0AA40A2J0_9PEZI|nr:ABC-2 type transporter-domain-containing protein [Lasiosphaeris hirsuta]